MNNKKKISKISFFFGCILYIFRIFLVLFVEHSIEQYRQSRNGMLKFYVYKESSNIVFEEFLRIDITPKTFDVQRN